MKKKIVLLLCAILVMITTACGSGTSTNNSGRYAAICKCEGRYVQREEDSTDTYGAELTFYEKDGKVYANIDYSGYMGTINDGEVEDSTDPDYLYEIHPMGKLTHQSETGMEFLFRFDEEKMYISWGETCEYTLTRSDGSPEDEVDQKTPFDEKEIYKLIVDKIDEAYESYNHKCSFDRDRKTLWICIEAPEGLRSKMESYYDELKDSWDNVVESLSNFGSSIYSAATTGYDPDVYFVNVYMVEKLKDDNNYLDSEIDLAIENGKITYNVASKYEKQGNSSFGSSDSSSYSKSNSGSSSSYSKNNSGNSNSSSGSGSYSASAGERNALEKAHQYLDYTAFSYSGLVGQLEYEGFTNSEATYAADHCGADWYEQAVKKAQDYLDYTSFSRDGLKDQLEYEGFTPDQASYGVQQAYH